MKILCIGDSNTFGYDPRSYIGSRYPAEVRWTDRLQGHTVINRGVNGMTVPAEYAAPRYIETIRKADADLVIIMLGTNDILMDRDAYETDDQMDDFIRAIKEAAKQILLIAPPLLQLGEWVPGEALIEESRVLGELYKETAARNGCLFANAGEWDIEMTFDGVHFSPEGHATFADKLEEKLKVAGDESPAF